MGRAGHMDKRELSCFAAMFIWAGFIVWVVPSPAIYVFRGVAGALAIRAAFIDWRSFELPLYYTLPSALIAVLGEGLFGPGWVEAFAGCLAGFAVLKGAQFFSRFQHKKECIGSGDAILMLSLGALVGIKGLLWALALAVGSIFIAAKVLQKGKSERMPFGPFLVAGSLFVAVIKWGGAM